ncbi:MAG: hypothetical protein IJ222_03570 [Bacteroidales bacterium]|nr:hypothetical protein [Bacteroidales bacterium]
MEDIRIYHSIWKNIALMAVCFVFVAMGIFILLHGKQSFIVWAGILFFSGGGLFVLFLILKERLTHTPYYMITDDGLIMNSGLKTYEVHFADVECFYLTKVGTAWGKAMLIVIQYKENVELQKFEDASKAGRAVRSFNKSVVGSQETLPTDGLMIRPKELCEILNERVKKSRNI